MPRSPRGCGTRSPVAAPDLHRLLLQPLHHTGIEYMVTGAVAAIAYGEPRMTNDVDIVIRLEPGDGETLVAAYGAPEYYVPPVETIEQEGARPRHGHFNVIHHATGLRADFYVAGDDPLHQWAWARRQTVPLGGDAIWFAPLEYVIVRKLEYFDQSGSDRHLRDIRGILRVSGDSVDHAALERLIAERGLSGSWAHVRGLGP